MSQPIERIAIVCKWMGWKRVRRGGGDYWEHRVPMSKNRTTFVYDPVSTYDPWKYRDDLHDVLLCAIKNGMSDSLCSRWLNKKDLAESMVKFATARPDEVMGELWPHIERTACESKNS